MVKYNRLKLSGTWDVPVKDKANFSGNNDQQVPKECFNCGKPGHMVPQCPEPIDRARVEAARKRFWANKRQGQGRPSGGRPNGRPNHQSRRPPNNSVGPTAANVRARKALTAADGRGRNWDTDGTPLIENKNGEMVPDSGFIFKQGNAQAPTSAEKKARRKEVAKLTKQVTAHIIDEYKKAQPPADGDTDKEPSKEAIASFIKTRGEEWVAQAAAAVARAGK